MSFISQSQKYLGCGLMAVAVIAMAVPAWAQFPELELTMSDTTVTAGDTSAWISVKIRNYQDTLSGFAMRIVLNRPDIMEFRTDEIDTVIDTLYYKCLAWYDGDCIDSQLRPVPLVDTFLVNRAVDTTGSLVRYWSNITVRSMSPSRHDLKVIGLADELGMPYTPGIKPRTSQGLLFRARVRVYDSLPPTDSVVTLYFIQNLSETNFSDPLGNLVGTITRYNICDTCYCEEWDPVGDSCGSGCLDTLPAVLDTMVIDTFFRYWICKEWGQGSQGDSCLNWGNYSSPDSAANADSTSIDSIPWTVWNDQTTFFDEGQLRVVSISCMCGDCNDDDAINVSDAVFLINYIFKGGQPPAYPECCDVNYDTAINIADVVYIINYIFKGGAAPYCGF